MCESCYLGDSLLPVMDNDGRKVGGVVAWGSAFRAAEYAIGRELQ